MNVTLLDSFLLQYFARNFLERRINTCLRSDFFRGFVEFEGELPAKNVHSGFFRALRFPDFGGNGIYVGASDGRIHRAHVHHASAFYAVQPNVSADRSGVVKLKDELAVGRFAFALLFQCIVRALKGCAFRRTDSDALDCSGGMIRLRIIPPILLGDAFGTAEAVPFQIASELRDLPRLAFVLAEVLDDEWLHAGGCRAGACAWCEWRSVPGRRQSSGG